ncbi:MAG: TonB-dependent receptor [Bacteroidota bacterium]
MQRTIYTTIFFLLSALPVISQENADTTYNIPPVIITATKATERKSPVTFSDISREEIQLRHTQQDVPTLLAELPSITTYSENGNGIGYNYISLRGFDQRRLSIMINGVPQNDPEDHNVYWIDFPDILGSAENIQVQRGAGSAFYGPPAIGGSINLTTSPFTLQQKIMLETSVNFQEFGGENSLELNARKYGVSYNSGLLEKKYLLYGKLSRLASDGYRENSYANLYSFFFAAARFDENFTTRIQLFGGPIEDGLAYYGIPKFLNGNTKLRRKNFSYWEASNKQLTFSLDRRKEEIENFHQPHFELMNDWSISSSMKFCNTIFYVQGDGSFDYDGSWADTSMLRIGYNYGIPATQNPANTLIRAYVGNKQFGILPRLEIEHQNGTFLAGSELRFHRSLHWGKIQSADLLPKNFNTDYHFYEYNGSKNIFSVYAHELYRLETKTTVMADVQFVYNQYKISGEKYLSNTFSLPYFFINPRIGINYNANEFSNVYTSVSYTSREPRLRNLYAAEDSYFGATPQFKITNVANGIPQYDFNSPLAQPEHLFNIEIGSTYRTNTAYCKINFYWMEFFDELVKSGQLDIFGQPVTGNADRTRHIGMEFDAAQQLSNSFDISGNLTISDNRLIHYDVYENGNKLNLSDNPIAGFPELLGNARITYHTEQLHLSALVKYVGSFYTDNFRIEEHRNDAYAICNIEALYTISTMFNSTIVLRGEIRNVFNTLYFSNGEGDAYFPAAERNYLFGCSVTL